MLLETPVVLFVIASLTAIVIFLLMVLLNQTQQKTVSSEEKNVDNLRRFILIDPSTGAYNRSFFQKKLEEETYRSARYNTSFSVAIYDFSSLFTETDTQKAESAFRKCVVSAVRDTRYSDFVSNLEDGRIAIIFTMTPKAHTEVPINRLLLKFKEILKEDGFKDNIGVKVIGFPEDKTELEKLIQELKE